MTRGKYKKWSAEEDSVISRMRAEGKSIREIAKSLNRSFSSVQGRVRILLGECKLQKIVITGYSRSVKPKTTGTKKTKKSKINYQKKSNDYKRKRFLRKVIILLILTLITIIGMFFTNLIA